MLASLKCNLVIDNLKVPPEKEIVNRLKGFYSNRTTSLISDDTDKNRKRKLSVKASRRTFVSYCYFFDNNITKDVIITSAG